MPRSKDKKTVSADLSYAWRGDQLSGLVLGTAQLGLRYGIANDSGQPSVQAAITMVETAWRHGIRGFDTAQAYGDSEAVLGEALARAGIGEAAVVCTKLSPELDPQFPEGIREAVAASRRKLRQKTLWGVMLHRPQWLEQWGQGLGAVLRNCRSEGWLHHLGVSVYSVAEAMSALDHPDIDFIQAPGNAWDQRMIEQGVFASAAARDKLCFIRSIYLQGLLAMAPERVAARLPAAAVAAAVWHRYAAERAVSPLELAMAAVKALGQPLVFGAETTGQIDDNVRLYHSVEALSADVLCELRNRLRPVLSPEILNPSCWP